MNAVVRTEALKLVRSPVGAIATLSLVVGTLALLGGIAAAVASGNPELTAKVGAGGTPDWPGLLTSAAQVTSAGGLLAGGVVLAWLFGREFADGTVVALFALPVGRGHIALGKLAVYAVWLVVVNTALTGGLLALGAALGYGAPSADTWSGLGRQLVLGVLMGASATPVAWVATVTHSLLAGVGGAIGLVVLAQVGVLAGAGGWLPLAAPVLWAVSEGSSVTIVQLGLTLVVTVAFASWTAASWQRMQVAR